MHLIETDLTKEQKEYLQTLFFKYEEELQEKIYKKLAEEFMLLSKYKGELSRKFTELNGFYGTLLGCMKEMLDKEEALWLIHSDLINLLERKFPESNDGIFKVIEDERKI